MKILFRLTNEFSGFFGILFRSLEGECLKFLYAIGVVKCRDFGVNKSPREEKVIISLTSYGRRVRKTLPLTITSLLKQTYKPDMVLLWLDYSWQNKDLPSRLKKLIDYGLTIKYCEDIKSYKKLIPTLLEYPNEVIITTDDDVFLYDLNEMKKHNDGDYLYLYHDLDEIDKKTNLLRGGK